jgi:hypothetical protein
VKLYWGYESEACRQAGALPPVPLALDYGKRSSDSPFVSGDYRTIWRAIEAGYEVKPGDCPPVRLIARYGWIVRCPGAVVMRRLPERLAVRELGKERARFGIAEVGGSPWPQSDSGFVASWIAGSEFVKVQTGIWIYFPEGFNLYQGPLPNPGLLPATNIEVMAGIEYWTAARTQRIRGEVYGVAMINVIVRLPPLARVACLAPGDPIVWVFPVPPQGALALEPLPSCGEA